MINLREAFNLGSREVISIVGAGGKTTLMFALAAELADAGNKVVSTTTTKIFPPLPDQSPLLILSQDEDKLLSEVSKNLGNYNHITVAIEKLTSGKLKGVSSEAVCRLAELCPYVISEADGAARRPLKAPNATEPVIPDITTLVIPVVGIEAIGCPLDETTVFRPDIAAHLTGLKIGDVITVDAVALLLTHPQGIIKGTPPRARIVPLLNKIDLLGDVSRGEELAHKILAKNHPQISHVVLGQIKLFPPVYSVITRSSRL